MQPDARELSRMLARQVPALTAELLPQGHREGAEWVHPSLTGTSRRSLSVRLTGTKAGVWSDFASGEAGDALSLVAAVRFAGDTRAAMDWARGWLGLTLHQPGQSAHRPMPAQPAQNPEPDRDQAERRAKALALFLRAPEGLVDTPAAAYLAGRGIDLAELGRAPRSLRFHPTVWCEETGARLPAMLAAITDGAGVHVATHRTWLARRRDGGWMKAQLRNAKKSYGSYAGGFIPLQRGASKRPLRDAPEGETVGIAEGIETALSVAVACPELRILAGVSLSNMARIVLPETIGTVILCADNDKPENIAAERGLVAAINHFANAGKTVRLARPTMGKDWNDMLQAGNLR